MQRGLAGVIGFGLVSVNGPLHDDALATPTLEAGSGAWAINVHDAAEHAEKMRGGNVWWAGGGGGCNQRLEAL